MNVQDATTHDGHGIDTSEQRAANSEQGGEQMPMPVRFDTQKGSRSEVLPDALGRSSKQRESPRNPAQKLWSRKQREKRPESDRQHFVLSTRDPPFFFDLLLL